MPIKPDIDGVTPLYIASQKGTQGREALAPNRGIVYIDINQARNAGVTPHFHR